jgi:sugar/nucleoside kinase (ribokinase family)
MIIVFGALYFHQVYKPENQKNESHSHQVIARDHVTMPFGGSAANQAFCAHRMGSKTAIVGSVADDFDGTRILTRLKRYGVMTSGVAARAHNADTEDVTGIQTFIMPDDYTIEKSYTSYGANKKTTDDQVPDELLLEKNLVLTQSELPTHATERIVQRATSQNVTTIHTLYDGIPHNTEMLSVTPAIMISGLAESKSIKIEEKEESKLIVMPHLSPYIFDTFCGTFASAYDTYADTDIAINYAMSAAELTIKHKKINAYFQHDINNLYAAQYE